MILGMTNVNKDCKVVISHGMGRRIYYDWKDIGIEVFFMEETDVEKYLHLYLSGKLIDRQEIGYQHEHE